MARNKGYRVCAEPNCPTLVIGSYCDPHSAAKRRHYQRNSYGYEWPRISARQLSNHPYCQCMDWECKVCFGKHGIVSNVPATEADHIIKLESFTTRSSAHSPINLQSLCSKCHSSKTIRKDRSSKLKEV